METITMQELYNNYNEITKQAGEQREQIEQRIEKVKKQIERLEKKKQKIKSPSWYRDVVEILAKTISDKIGLNYDIYGPFGLNARTSIYFMKDTTKSITEQPTKRITIIPHWDNGFYLTYETGEKKTQYERGSIGELNGFNNITEVLPNNIDEIIKIVNKNSIIF